MRWNFGDLFTAVADAVPADHVALIHGDDSITWRELQRRSNNIAYSLQCAGLAPGDKVAFYLRNKPAYLETLVACFKSGLVHVNVNYRYKAGELHYILDNADARAVLFDAEFRPLIDAVRDRLPEVRAWIEIGGSGDAGVNGYRYTVFSASGDGADLTWSRSPDDLFFIYTGGTTGMPKGVMWTHDTLLQAQMAYSSGLDGLPPPHSVEEFIARLGPAQLQARQLPAPPLMHATALIGALGVLLRGGSIVTLEDRGAGFDAEALWRAVERHRVSALTIVGDAFAAPMLRVLDAAPGRFDLGCVQSIASSGVAWSAANKQGLLRHLPQAMLIDGLGSSEAPACGVAVTTVDSEAAAPRFRVSATCRVFSEDGREIQPGSAEPGLIALSGNIPLGYYKDEEKTRRTFRLFDGVRYAVPGDLCTVAQDGTLTFLGRGSQCINSGGEKIFAEEVEEVLKTHAAVRDAIVIGMPDPQWGQAVVAVVAAERAVAADALRAHVRARLANYKVPKTVLFSATLQRLPNGKPDYAAIRAYAQNALASAQS